jgi:hypothetical protein
MSAMVNGEGLSKYYVSRLPGNTKANLRELFFVYKFLLNILRARGSAYSMASLLILTGFDDVP